MLKKQGVLKVAVIAGIILVTLILGVVIVRIGFEGLSSKKQVSVTVLEHMVESASDLITTKYIYRNLYEYNNRQIGALELPWDVDQLLLIYTGTIYVGVDLSEISFKIDESNQKIIIKLPKLGIIAHNLDDSIEAKTIKDSILTNIDFEKNGEIRSDMKQIMEEELQQNDEFWEMAEKNTQNALIVLFSNSESTKDYEIVFK